MHTIRFISTRDTKTGAMYDIGIIKGIIATYNSMLYFGPVKSGTDVSLLLSIDLYDPATKKIQRSYYEP